MEVKLNPLKCILCDISLVIHFRYFQLTFLSFSSISLTTSSSLAQMQAVA